MNNHTNEPKIIAVALNPSLDRTITTHYLAVGYQNRTNESTQLAPASPPMNIARAAHHLGAYTHMITLLGKDATGVAYEALVRTEGYEVTVLPVEGKTRSRIIIYDDATHKETQIIEEGQKLTDEDHHRLAETLKATITPEDYVIFAGRLGAGESEDTYARLIDVAQDAGAHVTVARGGNTLAETLSYEPELIALTSQEAEGLLNYPVRRVEDIIGAGQYLRSLGAQDILMYLTDQSCAFLMSDQGFLQVDLPAVSAGTSSGEWEALVGGFLAGVLQHRSVDDALRLGGGAAAYASSQIGLNFASTEEALAQNDQITVHRVVTVPSVFGP